MRKVAFFLYSFNGRGQSKVMSDIAGGLARQGDSVTFFYTELEGDQYIKKHEDVVFLTGLIVWGEFLLL